MSPAQTPRARRRPKVPPRPPCQPVGPLEDVPSDPARCTCGTGHACRCGQPMVRFPGGETDPARQEWTWVCADGSPVVVDNTPEELRTKAGWDAWARRDTPTYSLVSATWDLGCNPFHHHHWPEPCGYASTGHPEGTMPWCCAMPMMRRPAGWGCRETGEFFKFDGSARLLD